MIRKSKAFGLALVAIFAMSALVAQAASAIPFTSPGAGATQKTFITGEVDPGSEHIFKNGGGEVKCTTISFFGEATGPEQTSQTISPSYSGCTAFGFTAHVKPNGCTYTFAAPTATVTGGWTGAPPTIDCPGASKIEITPTFFGASVCTQFIAPQTPTGGHMIYKNAGGADPEMDITTETTVTGIHYTGTGSVCGNSETHSDGEYSGNTTLKGYSNAAHTTRHSITMN